MPEPKVTVIVPAFNEEGKILRVLEPLAQWQRKIPGKRQIVVVNDASTDRTAEVSEKFFRDSLPGGGKTIDSSPAKRNFGKAQAFITGAFHAKENGSDIIVSLDADIRDLQANKVEKLVSELNRSSKNMLIPKQFEGGRPRGLSEDISGPRAIRVVALEPLFRNNPKWVELMKGFALEMALNYLIPKRGRSSVSFSTGYAYRTSTPETQIRDFRDFHQKVEERRRVAQGVSKMLLLPDILGSGHATFKVGELHKKDSLNSLFFRWGLPRIGFKKWKEKVGFARKWLRSQQQSKPHLRHKY